MNAARQGGGAQEGGSSSRWWRTVEKIKNEAQGVNERIPGYYMSRFDAIANREYPSIFRLDSLQPISHTGDTALSYPASQLAPPATQQAALLHHTSPASPTDRQIVVAAVGPYHHSTPVTTSQTQPVITRETKCGIVMFLAQQRFGLSASEFLEWAWENENRARGCYEQNSFTMRSEEFSEMLLLDGCLLLFAIFLLRSSVSEDGLPARLAEDPDRQRRKEFISLSADITLNMEQTRLDLLVLDNQIPFFVVAELHERLQGTLFEGINHTIKQMALSCFDEVHPMGRRGTADDMPDPVHHLLHLFHWSRVPSGKYSVNHSSLLPNEPRLHLPSVTDLRESATLFKKKTSGNPLDLLFRKKTSGHPLDLSFHSRCCGYGVMKIPTLYLYDYSEQIFRNLIGFEQRHLRCGLGVTAYSTSMARLLQSEADAKLLRNEKILAHTPKTDKEIVDFFRRLGDEYKYTLKTDDLLKFYNDVRRHHESGVRRMIGGIMLQYFPTRLITTVVICGLIFYFASLSYNIHNVYRYYHPRKQ